MILLADEVVHQFFCSLLVSMLVFVSGIGLVKEDWEKDTNNEEDKENINSCETTNNENSFKIDHIDDQKILTVNGYGHK